MSNYLKSSLLCGVGLVGLLAAPAFAQTPPPSNTKPISTIETVVVTAERRSENVQDVPISMSAISGEDLDKKGIRGFQELTFHTPALHFAPTTEGGENQISMRGIGNVNVLVSGDSPVGYLVDGVYMGRSTSIDPEFFDVNRVEILRGPQGTLYGRNSVGGSVNVITNQPTDELSGHVDALVGDYNARIFRGWANVPLYDCGDCQILARIVGVSSKHDAYQKNLSTAPTATHNSDAGDFNLLRGQLLFNFNADVSLLLAGSTSSNGAPVAFKIAAVGTPGDRYSLLGASPNPSDPRKIYKDSPETNDQRNYTASATLNWNLGEVKFTSITGWGKQHWTVNYDDDGSDLNLSNHQNVHAEQKQWSEELHLSSNNDASPFKWIVGAFFFHEKAFQLGTITNPGFNVVFGQQVKHSNSQAGFGQIDYDLGKTSAGIPLTITAGARYTHDAKAGLRHLQIAAFGLLSDLPWKGNEGQWTGKFGLSYKVTPDAMIYANVSRGYLAGGNLGKTYLPETAMAYEAGFKTSWLENRLQFNGAAYLTKLKNQQVFKVDPVATVVDNAAKSTIKGIEADLVAIPVEGLQLDAQLSLMSAKYDEYVTLDNRYSPSPPANWAGNRLVQTPEYTIGLGAEYAIQTSVGTFTPRVDTFISGDLYFVSDNDPRDRQKAYTRTNVNLNWTEPSGRWTVDAFVANLENKDIIAQDGLQGSNIPNIGQAYDAYIYYPPRTVGIRFGANF